jgi:hypothetical protein
MFNLLSRRNRLLLQVVRAYVKAIQLGSKYIYQIVPRLLTIWLDLGQTPEKTTDDLLRSVLREMSGLGQNSVSIRVRPNLTRIIHRILMQLSGTSLSRKWSRGSTTHILKPRNS